MCRCEIVVKINQYVLLQHYAKNLAAYVFFNCAVCSVYVGEFVDIFIFIFQVVCLMIETMSS